MTISTVALRRLRPQDTRTDKGQVRTLTPEQQKWILEQAQAHLGVPVKVLYRRWKEQDPELASLNTVYRLLREHELSTKTRRQLLKQPLGGATKAFEAPFVNDLWMVDFSPGPFLHPPGQAKALATHLCVIIDDHSRVIPYAGYFPQADTRAFHQTLKEAIRRRGLPAKLYTDNGGPFVNDHTRIVCARLGIRLIARQAFSQLVKRESRAGLFHHSGRLSKPACACLARTPPRSKNSTPSSRSGCRAFTTPASIPAPA